MISIIIPCYNDQDVLPTAVRSAINQRYTDTEIIIVDDGSKTPIENNFDSSLTRVIRHPENLGLPAALNTGIQQARGDRFVILASDDELHYAHLKTLSEVDADIVSVDMMIGGKVIAAKAPESLEELMRQNCHSYAALIRKWVWKAAGGFKTTMNPSWEDWEFFLNAYKVGAKWQHVAQPLHIYNRNPTGRDANAQGKEELLWGKLRGYHQDLYGIGKGVVSFVVPCYDHEQYVAEAVQSALNQAYPHINVVVVDDGSPGDTAEALSELPDLSRVTLIRQNNRHLSGARNSGIFYAVSKFGSEYIVPLDADDQVHPEFVEATMANRQGQEYLYTDVHFIGDAYHSVPMKDYECEQLVKTHLHPCTILMPSRMWQDTLAQRGYGYDETMKRGYEDWEFVLAAVEQGWCGRRVPGEYFYYRYHQNGSMRTRANKIKGELVGYMKKKHPWMILKDEVDKMCKTCGGGGRFTKSGSIKGGVSTVFIPGIGEVMPTEVLVVVYTGSTTSTIVKQGNGGQIYKFSADPEKQARGYGPKFTIKAIDAHLFVGPYTITKLEQEIAAVANAPSALAARRVEVQVVEVKPKESPAMPAPVVPEPEVVPVAPKKLDDMPIEEALELTDAGKEFAPEDFTEIKGIGPSGHKKLVAAGFTLYDDVAEANPIELASVLGMGKEQAAAIIEDAKTLLSELEEV